MNGEEGKAAGAVGLDQPFGIDAQHVVLVPVNEILARSAGGRESEK